MSIPESIGGHLFKDMQSKHESWPGKVIPWPCLYLPGMAGFHTMGFQELMGFRTSFLSLSYIC